MFKPAACLISLCLWSSPIWAADKKLPLSDLQRFTHVLENIHTYYVEPTQDSKLFEDAIRGMLEGLDPHSAYMDQEEYTELKEQTYGKFGGLGIEILPENGLLRIITPIDDTPAAKAGLQPGDLISQIDDKPIKGIPMRDLLKMMRGSPGSPVKLTIIRDGQASPLYFTIKREIIKVKSVKHKVLENNYGYIRVSQFQSSSAADFKKAVKNLHKSTQQNLKGLVLDLRNNPGGILEACTEIIDSFIDKNKIGDNKLIVYTEGRIQGSNMKEFVHHGDITHHVPLIVLINGGSASASEIVAGAVQDHKRGLILGTPSFGKGTVQTILPLKENRGLKITTALYYTPLGRSIQATGIIPDIEVPALQIPLMDKEATSPFYFSEKSLKGHLQNGNSPTAAKSPDKEKEKDEALPLWHTDYQLYQALTLLKGMSF